MKRITSSLLALLLALSMLIGMVPAAYATDYTDTIESIGSTETADSTETKDVSDESEDVAAQVAGGTDVAAVGGVGYPTLAAAIDAATASATVTLLADTTVESTLTISKALTLDLNGNTLTVSTNGDGISVEDTTLTLTNSGSTGKYVFNCSASGSDGIFVSNTTEGTVTTLNINSNVEISTTSRVNSAIHAYAPNGSAVVNMNDGKIAVSGNGKFSAVIADQNSTVNINGGEFDLNVDFDSYSDGNDVVGVLAWGQNGVQKNIAVNIKGGIFKVGGKNAFAQAVQVGMKNGASENVTVNISGGNVILNPTDGGKGFVYAPFNSTYATATMTGGSVSGNVTALTITNKGEDTADLSVSGGTFATTADTRLSVEKYVAEGSTYDSETGTVTSGSSTPGVATVGTTTYNTLEEAISALNSTDYTLKLLDESAWNTATPVYWEAGEQSGYVAKLTDALTAAYTANAGDIKIVCRPGADVGTMTHGHVADGITIFGNNAYISGGECDLEVDTYMFSRETGKLVTADGAYLDKNITITAYELDNLGVWGERHTAYTVNVNLTDCDGKAIEGKPNVQRVYISGTTGKNEITLKNCDFITAATAVYSNADGAIMIDRCSFTDSKVPVNFNHKANGEQRLTVSNSTFTNCGDDGDWKQFAAPVRFVNSGSGTQTASVDSCTFAGTAGSNGDILLGDGRTGQESNDVTLTVTNTKATVQAQKPGYYNGAATDKNNGAEMKVESGETLNTSVEKMLPTALTAYVTVNGGTEQYATLDEAIAAAEPENGVITYTVTGKVNANGESWIQVAKAGLTGLTEVKFVGADENAEICITNSTAVLADQSYDIDVSFKDLTLSHPNGAWVGDLGHATNYFTTVLRNTDAANNTVTYTNCTFPNGACNNQYGKTVYTNCTFTGTSGLSGLWIYGGDVELNGGEFNGPRGVKVYTEGTPEKTPNVTIKDTAFKNQKEKAAIVVSKAASVTLENVSASNCIKGLLQKSIEGSSADQEVTVKANGSGISGEFNITANKDAEAAKNEFNISAGTFDAEVSSDYCADGFEVKDNGNGTYGVVGKTSTADGSETNPYTLEDLRTMTRAEYIAAQERLGGTMYVTVGDYNYDKNGVLGNGVRDDTTGQIPDHSKLNAYGENGYLGEKNDGANGKNIVFVGGKITSGVTGYKSIDYIGTSLLLAVPAYTNVTFKGTEFNNVMSFDYQLYTSPWSQLGELKFDGCKFNGIIVGAIAAQTLTFNNCNFSDYTNTYEEDGKNVGANSSNPTWIRPAYGNWTKGDNEGQGGDFRSLTQINFTGNTVTSTRPVKFERIAQWEMDTTVTATGNKFDISAQDGDTSTKNVGLYFGANAKFNLIADNNTKSDNTAALYTAAYKAPNEKDYAGLPAGSTVKDSTGKDVELEAFEWKSDKKLTLKTTEEVASVTNAKGTVVNFASLSDAIAAAADGDTVKLLTDTTEDVVINKNITLDLNGKTLTNTNSGKATLTVASGATVIVKNGNVVGGTSYYTIQNNGTATFEDVTATAGNTGSSMLDNWGTLTITSGTYTGGLNVVKCEEYSKTTINGGKIEGGTPSSKGYTGVVINYGELTINDGEFIQNNKTGRYQYLQTIFTDKDPVTGAIGTTTINGGDFKNLDTRSGCWCIRSSNAATPTTKVSGGTFNKELQTSYIAEGSYLTKNADGTFGVAKGEIEAMIGKVGYPTLEEALAAAKGGDTVKLVKDAIVENQLAISTRLTLDLGGNTLTSTYEMGSASGEARYALTNKWALTIQNGTFAAGKARAIGAYYTLTLDNVTVTQQLTGGDACVAFCKDKKTYTIKNSTIDGAYAVCNFANNATITISDSELNGTGNTLYHNGSNYGLKLTVTNTTITSSGSCGVYISGSTDAQKNAANQNGVGGYQQATFTGCTISGTNGVEVKYTDLTLDNCTVTATVKTPSYSQNNNGPASVGFAVVSTDNAMNSATPKPEGTINITGANGKYTGPVGLGSLASVKETYTDFTDDTINVSSGTFDRAVLPEYCADGFVPVDNGNGTYGVKEGTYVAEVNGTKYETLQAAINAAGSGEIVTLLCNTRENVTINNDITLDLGGKTLTNAGEHTIVNNGTLTIMDSVGTGKVDNVTHGHGALVNNGTVILSGGTFERSAEKGTFEPYGPGGNSWYTIANYGTMTINNGTTVKNAGGYSSNIRNGGQDSTAKLTINGGTFDGGVNTVKNDPNGVLEIKGGELKNTAQYVIMNWNQATISGGTFETAETAGAVLFSSTYGTDGTACGELTITGGTFKAAGNKLIVDAYDANNHGTVKIRGGSFNLAVDPKHCDTGFIPTQNEDGTYGVKEGTYVAETGGVYYESLQAAIDAARRNGTVKLLADTRENVTIGTPYVTLDLNGHTLNGGTEKGKPALTVTARVTVKDGSEAQTGTIMREDTAENSGVSSHYVIDVQGDGWLTFESGNVKNESGNANGKGASLVRVGNDEVRKFPGLNIKGGTFTQDNFIVIKVDRGDLFLNGGTLNSANSYAIEDWHRATIKGGTVNGAVAAWTYSGGLNSDLTISGGTINGDVTSVNYGNAEGRTAKVSITGGTINGNLDTRSYNPATNELTSIDDAAKATIEVTGGTFNNDPTKYVVENSKVTNNGDGTFGVEKAYLAKIGDKSYYTMDEAFHAVTEGQTIVLLRDYTTASSQNSGSKSFTFDLNGHTWTYTSTDVNCAAFEINYPDVTLTVKNGNVVSNSMLGLIPSAMGGTITYDNAGLVFEGIDATAKGHSGIETNGNNTNDSVTLRNSTLNVPDGFGIYFPSSGTLTIENSKINAKTMGVQVCAGSLKISGADTAITVTGDAVPKTENDGAIQDGAAISIVNRTGYKGLGTITVTGGTFTAKTGNAAIKAYNWANNTETDFTEPTKVEVSGGTFSAEVPADLCAVGYEPTEKDPSTGMYTVQKVSGNAYYVDDSGKPVYGDFAALVASTNTATKGKTITLLKDVKIEDNLVLFGNRTVDLNGNVLEITEIFIGLYGKVIDSSDGNGLLKIAADNMTLQSDNGLLPIYDSAKGGYRLFNVQMKGMTEGKGNGVVVKLMPSFTNKDAYKLMKVGSTNNITFTVTISWTSENGPASQEFTFDQSLVNRVAESWMNGKYGYFIITLTGLDSDVVGSIKDIKAQGSIKSGTGARIDSVYYDIPQN